MTTAQGTVNPMHRRIVLLVIAAAALIALFAITSNSSAPIQGSVTRPSTTIWKPRPQTTPNRPTTEQKPTPRYRGENQASS